VFSWLRVLSAMTKDVASLCVSIAYELQMVRRKIFGRAVHDGPSDEATDTSEWDDNFRRREPALVHGSPIAHVDLMTLPYSSFALNLRALMIITSAVFGESLSACVTLGCRSPAYVVIACACVHLNRTLLRAWPDLRVLYSFVACSNREFGR
jgi:hypothetical protein